MPLKKIPTLLGLILLVTAAFLGVIFLDQDTGFLPRAAPQIPPENVRITNISDTGFVVSWTTSEPTIGFIKLGSNESELATTYQDDRDQLSGNLESFRTHYVTITGLNPSTTYYFRIGDESQNEYDQKGKAFSTITAPKIDQSQTSNNLTGTVLTPVSTPAEGALVYLTFDNSAPLSALVKQNGSWNINLNLARTSNLNSSTIFQPNQTYVEILINDAINPNTVIVKKAISYQLEPIIIGTSSIDQPPDSAAQIESPQTLGAQDIATPSTEQTSTLPSPIPTTSSSDLDQQVTYLGTPSASLVAGNTTVSLTIFIAGLAIFIFGLFFIIKPT